MALHALCIGINTYGEGMNLVGCVNDAVDWRQAVTDRGGAPSLLTDGMATRAKMLTEMGAVMARAKRGDTVLITYSGHGTRVPDLDGDEADRWDEALCPVDLWTAGVITDDTLHDLVLESRVDGSRVIFISDSCHSGTVSRLAGPLGRTVPRKPRFLPPETFLTGEALERARHQPRVLVAATPRHPNLLMAGCMDHQYSYDASFEGRANGAFTYVALAALRDLHAGAGAAPGDLPPTYRQWYAEIARRLPSEDFPDQAPQIYGTTAQKRWRVLA